jgi:hypothetical protein
VRGNWKGLVHRDALAIRMTARHGFRAEKPIEPVRIGPLRS